MLQLVRSLRVASAALCALVAFTVAQATSVKPPSFDDLVRSADIVVRGEVTGIHAEWRGTGMERHITTVVKVAVQEKIVGSPADSLELEFLGGTVGDVTMGVEGQPRFRVGDQEILFVENNGRQICPLVAMMYGHYALLRDPTDVKRLLVLRANGAPMQSFDEVARPLPESRVDTKSALNVSRKFLTLDQFTAHVRERAQALGRKDVQP